MNSIHVRTFALIAVAAALSACGGSDSDDPSPTPVSATVLVSGATDTALNGTYSSTTVALNNVVKFNPVGGDPETCRTNFAGLKQANSTRLMDGDIRYIPGNTGLQTTFISINGVEFRLSGTVGGAVDKANNEIDFTGAKLTSTQGTNATIMLTGSIPMKGGRPEGC